MYNWKVAGNMICPTVLVKMKKKVGDFQKMSQSCPLKLTIKKFYNIIAYIRTIDHRSDDNES